jgi:di/tricarboxylate transporter
MSFALLGNQIVTAAIASVFLPVASRFGYAPLFFAFAIAAAAYFALVILRLYAGD